MYRQGDLLFVKSETPVPPDAMVVEDGVIARGESTGHTHRIATKAAILYILARQMYIEAKKRIEIKHEEHKPVVLPPGVWKVQRQREYEPNGWRQVQD
jgi:hypothetical protein